MSTTEALINLATSQLEFSVVPIAAVNANQEAEDCLDCENGLQIRISAHDILKQVERVTRSTHEMGDFDATERLVRMLHSARIAWSSRIPDFEKWIARCLANGFMIDNLARYRECVEDVEDWFEQRHWQEAVVSIYQER